MSHTIRTVMFTTLFTLAAGAACCLAQAPRAASASGERLNILLITADDMNWDGPGVYGSKTPGVTPNIDRLAAEGLRFTHSHITIAVCQPSRSVLMTGRYPHRNGAMGFEPIREDVPTLGESLRAAGYLNGILGKERHLEPREKFCWDTYVGVADLSQGRDPQKYYQYAKTFFEQARAAGRPFFLMANSHDPHRPFAGSERDRAQPNRPRARRGPADYPDPARMYEPQEICVPGFLPDLPAVRSEVAQYYSSVHRCDETVGEILRALRETHQEDRTLVMFLSDNGMAFPFAKTNCYLNSTRTPWIVRWPGRVKPGTVDSEHFISGIDFMPTVLEAAGLKPVEGMDGRSFLPVLRGEHQAGRDRVFTMFNQTAGKRDYPMRCLQDKRFGYIFNAWSDGTTVFLSESTGSASFKGMKAAASTDEGIAARVEFLDHRVPEEFYDLQADPNALKNLIDDPQYTAEVARFRMGLLELLRSTDDPVLDAFRKRIGR